MSNTKAFTVHFTDNGTMIIGHSGSTDYLRCFVTAAGQLSPNLATETNPLSVNLDINCNHNSDCGFIVCDRLHNAVVVLRGQAMTFNVKLFVYF